MNPRRRLVVAALGAQGVLGLAEARVQRRKIVGYLSAGNDGAEIVAGLARRGLDVRFEVRYSRELYQEPRPATVDREVAVAELLALEPDVLITYRLARTLALMRATRRIPIVCGYADDPVTSGMAKSLARPGYNVTGLSGNMRGVLQLLVVLLRSGMAGFRRLVTILPPANDRDVAARVFEEEMRLAGVEGEQRVARNVGEAEAVLAALDPTREAALVHNMREDETKRLALAAIRRRIVLAGLGTDEVDKGLLMGLTIGFSDPADRIAELTAKILRGADPAEIPFERGDKVFLELNRATAKAVGLALPPGWLLRATRVIG